MIHGKNILGFALSAKGQQKHQTVSSQSGEVLTGEFSEATLDEVEQALDKAHHAFELYAKVSGKTRATFLRAIAAEIEALGEPLVERCMAETGLPEVRILGERKRTCFQLESFAKVLEEGSWVEARIDRGDATRAPVPKPEIRKMLRPMGPVVVFTASNFPLAYSTAGVDTAAALAAGCPVIVKNHAAHFGAGEIVGQAIQKAAQDCGMPDGVFSLLNGFGFEVGQALVKHPYTKAVGFTGSLQGGKALFDLAQSREEPIPVFAEMGSTNPIALLPKALATRPESLAETLAGSITLGMGQFCTNPGLLVALAGDDLENFVSVFTKAFVTSTPQTMLNTKIRESYERLNAQALEQTGVELLALSEKVADAASNEGRPTLARVMGKDFLANPALHQEVFGPFSLLICCSDKSEMKTVLESVHGQLTSSVMAQEEDVREFQDCIDVLSHKAGRLIFNGVPTGVEVCAAMQHGGPFPATTDARFSSVGDDALKRFVRPLAYQDFPEAYLPDELKAENPLEIWRLQDGNWTKDVL
jgi:NADP-dependent aldehyde dehydrogenase